MESARAKKEKDPKKGDTGGGPVYDPGGPTLEGARIRRLGEQMFDICKGLGTVAHHRRGCFRSRRTAIQT